MYKRLTYYYKQLNESNKQIIVNSKRLSEYNK
jgi:hypothetical protein